MKDYFRVAALPRGMNKWINEWRTKSNLINHYMSLFAVRSHGLDGSLSRFIVFVSENERTAETVERYFDTWMNNEQNAHFSHALVDRTQQNLPESPESSIILCRRSRLINSLNILGTFQLDDNEQLEKDLLRSVWQLITTRATRLPAGATGQVWEYFTKHRLVPALYLPPDSATGVEDLRESVSNALGTILLHRDLIFDDYMVYAATNLFFQGNVEYQRVMPRTAIPRDPNADTITNQIVASLTAHWP